MKTIRYFLSFLIFIFFLTNLYSQNDLNINYGRINTINGQKIKVRNITFENDQFKFHLNPGNVVNYLSINKVIKVERKRGNYAMEFGLGLGAAGLLGAVIGSTNSGFDKQQQRNYIIGYTSLCTVVGLIWGSTQGKYKTVYTNPSYGLINTKTDYLINPDSYTLSSNKNYPRYK